MSKLLKCKIDVKKIKKELLYVGTKGTYLDIDIWINDEPDQYGNDVSIQQQNKKDSEKLYIGSGKMWQRREESAKTELDLASETAKFNDDMSDLPF